MSPEALSHLVQYIYIVSAGLFILSLKWMNSPASSRRGVIAGSLGMALAVAGTLVGFPGLTGGASGAQLELDHYRYGPSAWRSAFPSPTSCP